MAVLLIGAVTVSGILGSRRRRLMRPVVGDGQAVSGWSDEGPRPEIEDLLTGPSGSRRR